MGLLFRLVVTSLNTDIVKLKESNDQMCQALREAQEAQWVKNGEIAMLRTAVETVWIHSYLLHYLSLSIVAKTRIFGRCVKSKNGSDRV